MNTNAVATVKATKISEAHGAHCFIPADARPGALEPRINDLYSAGHVTGYGPGGPSRATCNGGPLCLGCSEVRVLSAEWTRRWQELDRQRQAR